MELIWKFQRVGGFNQKTFRGRGMDIFWNNTLFVLLSGQSIRAEKCWKPLPATLSEKIMYTSVGINRYFFCQKYFMKG